MKHENINFAQQSAHHTKIEIPTVPSWSALAKAINDQDLCKVVVNRKCEKSNRSTVAWGTNFYTNQSYSKRLHEELCQPKKLGSKFKALRQESPQSLPRLQLQYAPLIVLSTGGLALLGQQTWLLMVIFLFLFYSVKSFKDDACFYWREKTIHDFTFAIADFEKEMFDALNFIKLAELKVRGYKKGISIPPPISRIEYNQFWGNSCNPAGLQCIGLRRALCQSVKICMKEFGDQADESDCEKPENLLLFFLNEIISKFLAVRAVFCAEIELIQSHDFQRLEHITRMIDLAKNNLSKELSIIIIKRDTLKTRGTKLLQGYGITFVMQHLGEILMEARSDLQRCSDDLSFVEDVPKVAQRCRVLLEELRIHKKTFDEYLKALEHATNSLLENTNNSEFSTHKSANDHIKKNKAEREISNNSSLKKSGIKPATQPTKFTVVFQGIVQSNAQTHEKSTRCYEETGLDAGIIGELNSVLLERNKHLPPVKYKGECCETDEEHKRVDPFSISQELSFNTQGEGFEAPPAKGSLFSELKMAIASRNAVLSSELSSHKTKL